MPARSRYGIIISHASTAVSYLWRPSGWVAGNTVTNQLSTQTDTGQGLSLQRQSLEKGCGSSVPQHDRARAGSPTLVGSPALVYHSASLHGLQSEAEVSSLVEKHAFPSVVSSGQRRKLHTAGKGLAHSSACQVTERSPVARWGPAGLLFVFPSIPLSFHTGLLFPFKSPFHQLFA